MISVRSGKVRSIDDEFLNRSFSQQKISTEKQNSVKFLPLLKSSFKTYCGQTSLHGYSYLFRDESARFHILHQIIWTIVIIVSQHFPHLNLPFYNATYVQTDIQLCHLLKCSKYYCGVETCTQDCHKQFLKPITNNFTQVWESIFFKCK